MTTETAPRDTSEPRLHLSREAVIDRAFKIADTHGLSAVTIRRLAQDLGVTPMALYWHFKNKDELLNAVGDEVLASAALTFNSDTSWDEQLRIVMTRLVSALRAHPSVAMLAATRIMASEHGLELTEQTLALLRAAGFSVQQSANIAHQALFTAITLCSAQPGLEFGEKDDEILEAKRAMLAGLPADKYPNVIAAAFDLVDCIDEDLYYTAGVDLFVAGVLGMPRAG